MIVELRDQVDRQKKRIIDLNSEKFYLKTKCDKLIKQVAWLENK